MTPLSANSFDTLLHHHNLTSQYPNLAWNLRNSFPLQKFSYLHNSYLHPNHSNSLSEAAEILTYITNEVADGCMSGPFTWEAGSRQGHCITARRGR